jgi:ABC-type uncharacterized transport system ATPase subunit
MLALEARGLEKRFQTTVAVDGIELEIPAKLMRGLILTGDLGWAATHALWLVLFSVLVFPPALNLMRRRLVT